MAYSLRRKKHFDNISKNLKKNVDPKFYSLLGDRINGDQFIDKFGQEFIRILYQWSFGVVFKLCTEHGIFKAINNGKTLKELLFDLEWKNESMLADVLDTLVDFSILGRKGREYHPIAISERTGSVTPAKLAELSLKNADTQWIGQSAEYRPIFSFYKKLITGNVRKSLVTGIPTASLRGSEPSQLSSIYDSLLKTPPYVIPRMAAIASAITNNNPNTILDLSCSTGRGVEEILLCKPDVKLILGVDANSQQIEIAKRNISILQTKTKFQEDAVSFNVIDNSISLLDQLSEYSEKFDMILLNQHLSWIPKDRHLPVIQELQNMLQPNGIIAIYQPLRSSSDIPWPDEWILQVIEGFYGYPNEKDIIELLGKKTQTIIPYLAYSALN